MGALDNMENSGSFFNYFYLVILIFLSGLAYQYFTVDRSMEIYTQDYINTALKNHDNHKLLKISPDKQTFKTLKSQEHVVIHFTTDNQGSRDIAYFPAKIGPKSKYYGITIKMKSLLHHQYDLKEIIRMDALPS